MTRRGFGGVEAPHLLEERYPRRAAGRGAAWLARAAGGREVASSNLAAPIEAPFHAATPVRGRVIDAKEAWATDVDLDRPVRRRVAGRTSAPDGGVLPSTRWSRSCRRRARSRRASSGSSSTPPTSDRDAARDSDQARFRGQRR